MTIGSLKTFSYVYDGLALEVTAEDLGSGERPHSPSNALTGTPISTRFIGTTASPMTSSSIWVAKEDTPWA